MFHLFCSLLFVFCPRAMTSCYPSWTNSKYMHTLKVKVAPKLPASTITFGKQSNNNVASSKHNNVNRTNNRIIQNNKHPIPTTRSFNKNYEHYILNNSFQLNLRRFQHGRGGEPGQTWINPENVVPGEALKKYAKDLTELGNLSLISISYSKLLLENLIL